MKIFITGKCYRADKQIDASFAGQSNPSPPATDLPVLLNSCSRSVCAGTDRPNFITGPWAAIKREFSKSFPRVPILAGLLLSSHIIAWPYLIFYYSNSGTGTRNSELPITLSKRSRLPIYRLRFFNEMNFITIKNMFDIDSNSGISAHSSFKLLKAFKSSKEELIPKLSD